MAMVIISVCGCITPSTLIQLGACDISVSMPCPCCVMAMSHEEEEKEDIISGDNSLSDSSLD
jgi:hypothetical protein